MDVKTIIMTGDTWIRPVVHRLYGRPRDEAVADQLAKQAAQIPAVPMESAPARRLPRRSQSPRRLTKAKWRLTRAAT
jgi:hypothetical protein